MPNFRKFKFWVQGILPLVYEDSLSYYEVLAKLTSKVNELIQYVNTLIRPSFKASVEYGSENNVEITETEEGYDLKFTLTIPPENEFPSVDAMKAGANTIPTLAYVRTMSYYNTPFGGGAIYRIYDSAPNGYYELLEDGRYAKLMYDSVVNVKQFGAIDDDTFDNTTAFQSAMDCNCDVLVPFRRGGTYYIAGEVSIDDNVNRSTTIRGDSESWYGKIRFGSNGFFNVTAYNVGFENLFIEGAGASIGKLIRIARTYDIDARIHNCVFRQSGNAIEAIGRGLYVDQCSFVNCANAIEITYTGIASTDITTSNVVGGRAFRIINNRFHSGIGNAVRLNGNIYGIQIDGNYCDGPRRLVSGANLNIIGLEITNNICIHFDYVAIVFDASVIKQFNIDNNIFDNRRQVLGGENPEYIINFTGDSTVLEDGSFSDNTFDGCKRSAIHSAAFTSIKAIKFCGNVFGESICTEVVMGVIVLEGATNNTISYIVVSNNVVNNANAVCLFRGRGSPNFGTNIVCEGNVITHGTVIPDFALSNNSIVLANNIDVNGAHGRRVVVDVAVSGSAPAVGQLYVYTANLPTPFVCTSCYFDSEINNPLVVSSPVQAPNNQILARIYNPANAAVTITGTMHFVFEIL